MQQTAHVRERQDIRASSARSELSHCCKANEEGGRGAEGDVECGRALREGRQSAPSSTAAAFRHRLAAVTHLPSSSRCSGNEPSCTLQGQRESEREQQRPRPPAVSPRRLPVRHRQMVVWIRSTQREPAVAIRYLRSLPIVMHSRLAARKERAARRVRASSRAASRLSLFEPNSAARRTPTTGGCGCIG